MNDYVIGLYNTPAQVNAADWDALLCAQAQPTPFMRHAYLHALHASGSACPGTGWDACFVTLRQHNTLVAATVLYIKSHSMGEYVFDWAWANAYQQHGLHYYPKGVLAVPFTPVPASKLLARNATARAALLRTLLQLAQQWKLSSLHLLFTDAADRAAAQQAGMLLRHTVQFHWSNHPDGYPDFDAFLASLAQDKRKKIRQERRKVQQAGIRFRHAHGRDIPAADWEFFYRCYERTYLEHGNAPYLSRNFFARMAQTMPENWLLFIAERQGHPIASSLIALTQPAAGEAAAAHSKTAYGRYWGALERVDCLHFEACYYQPLEWCIAHGYQRFEGGAQGEHKMARALLPVQTTSAHWIAHPEFSRAIANFLGREAEGVGNYMEELRTRSPFRQVPDGG
ncbi:MAG: GNAT family N-acetyltransferase [Rhodoferax sp.]|nr:GNAT family N-acetyltransferase [Rhodoferax sp.]